tara:strand:+ start:4336 stop:4662 length:327 start_codon:yes stop_codon:yes gene_type:complete
LKKNKNLNLIVQAIEEKKGININIIDFINIMNGPADFFVICSAQSKTQINAIANNIKSLLLQNNNTSLWQEEGIETNWRLLDYGDIVIHILKEETRDYYNLDDLWLEI